MLRFTALALALVPFASCASPSTQDSPSMPDPSEMAMDAGAMEMPQPTEAHAMLRKNIGVWEGTLTSFTPGMPTDPMPAREVVRANGPFWVTTLFTCDFMGMPYEGYGAMGYDSITGKYCGTWRDNMSSYMSVMEGERRADGTLVNRWQAPDMTGQMADHVYEHKMQGDDAYTMDFTMNGEPSMRIEMKRVSDTPR